MHCPWCYRNRDSSSVASSSYHQHQRDESAHLPLSKVVNVFVLVFVCKSYLYFISLPCQYERDELGYCTIIYPSQSLYIYMSLSLSLSFSLSLCVCYICVSALYLVSMKEMNWAIAPSSTPLKVAKLHNLKCQCTKDNRNNVLKMV